CSVTIVVRGLGANTGTTVYEAWVIDANGPTAIGGFTVGSDGLGYLTSAPGPGAAGVTVALTLEPVAGDTKPAGPVISSGVAGS
ncbi:MAG TPA: anti-sigma factor, partial [Candidatus Acidoferrum sp.]|nr:anti-sigma factor [Candidatus Acidoferrum sp.]